MTRLLRWYRRNARDLPWRRTKDPYAIWVAEIMLQQTTVETVIPYYEKFLKRFPTVRSLARADEEEVLRCWSGLGYYSRARNLHRASRIVVEKYEGLLPSKVEDLLSLPGIGRYTAGAIASIAFGQRAPILDGNVTRVLSRLFALAQETKSSKGQKTLWKKAEEILPQKNCGEFNQALMELGATVCLPENPLCPQCPIAGICLGRKNPGIFPRPAERTKYKNVSLTAAVVVQGDKFLLVQRPQKGLLKGMWEFPMTEGSEGELLRQWPIRSDGALETVRHSVLNRRLKITPLVCRLQGVLPRERTYRWVSKKEWDRLPTSSMNRKIFANFSKSF